MSGSGTGSPISGVLTEYTQLPYLSALWVYNSGAVTYTNNTLAAQSSSSTPFALVAASGDFVYYGSQSRFDSLIFTISVAASYSGIKYEIYTAAGWTQIIPRVNYDYSKLGGEQFANLVDWLPLAFSNTVPHTATVPDTKSRYWIRMSASTITTAATVTKVYCNPFARYTTPTKVSAILQVPAFSTTTTPTYAQVEDIIHRKQDEIDYRAKKSWRFNFNLNEEHEFTLTGLRLLRQDIISIIQLRIWNGSAFETKTEGRTNDYFVQKATGEIYFSRYFLLPARLAFTGPHWWGWGVGEFTYAVQIDYIYGRDLETDGQGYIVEDIATKMTARDIMMDHDYSLLFPSGSDKVSMDRKIERWDLEVEEKLESLRSWQML